MTRAPLFTCHQFTKLLLADRRSLSLALAARDWYLFRDAAH